ncbi:MAG TPA: 2'-5' RNA ligase family protein [Micrococcaceae bacterium]
MQRFFGAPMTRWASMRNRLHVYVLPQAELRVELEARQRALESAEYCSIQPGGFLHATVQQFAVTSEEVSAGQLAAFNGALADLAAATEPFGVDLDAPLADDFSLGVRGTPTPPWRALVERVRSAGAETINAGFRLPGAPGRPHISLGYGLADGSTAQVQAAADALALRRLPALRVDGVHVLAVHQDVRRGIFTWDSSALHRLRG